MKVCLKGVITIDEVRARYTIHDFDYDLNFGHLQLQLSTSYPVLFIFLADHLCIFFVT